MLRMQQWLRKWQHHIKPTQSLDAALFSKNFWQYSLFRLHHFGISLCLETLVHLAEFYFLWLVLSEPLAVTLIALRAGTLIVSGFWWGMLEVLRERIQEYQKEQSQKLYTELLCWFGFGIIVSVVAIIMTLSFLVYTLLRAKTYAHLIVACYILAITIQLSAQLIARTIHAGIFAVQKIYRPLWSLAIPNIFSLLLLAILIPCLGQSRLGFIILLYSISAATFTLYFAKQTYLTMGEQLKETTLSKRILWDFFKQLPYKKLLYTGSASAVIKLDGILLLLFFTHEQQRGTQYEAIFLLFLLSSLIRGCFDWVRLWYYDLKKLSDPLFFPCSKKFLRQSFFLALAIGVILFIIASLLIMLLSLFATLQWTSALLPFLVICSLMALLQMQAFTMAHYKSIIVSGIILLGSAFLFTHFLSSTPSIMLALSGALAVSAIFMMMLQRWFRAHPGSNFIELQFFLLWLERLCMTKTSANVTVIYLADHCKINHQVLIYNIFTKIISTGGGICYFRKNKIMLFHKKPKGPIDQKFFAGYSEGFVIKMFESVSYLNGAAALQALSQTSWFQEDIIKPYQQSFLNREHIINEFMNRFPEGYYHDVINDRGNLSMLPKSTYLGMLDNSRQFLKTEEKRESLQDYYYQSFYQHYAIEVFFIIPIRAGIRNVESWELFLRENNVGRILSNIFSSTLVTKR